MTTLKKILENIKHHRINGVNVGLSRELEVYHKGVIDNIVINAYKSIIMEEVERLEGKKYDIDWTDGRKMYGGNSEHTSNEALAYNQALQDQINYLKDKLNEIE